METHADLIALDSALAQMLAAVTPVTESSQLPLAQCYGRISAHAIRSPLSVPGFDNSAMDGYAVRVADVGEAPLPIAGVSLAGQGFTGEWQAASCVRIMTGAPLPDGCDAVIMQEQATVSEQGVSFAMRPTPGLNIRRCGEDIGAGDEVIHAGQQLNASNLPLLASLGISELSVLRKLRVALFSTGDELQPPGAPLAAGQIYETNRLAISLLLAQLGCEVMDLGIVRDDPQALRAAFIRADSQADVVISSAGVSVGERDHTRTVLQQLGEIMFWRLAIKPGKPFAFGRLSHSWFCGLPGNPVSAVITFYQLVQPLLAKLAGRQEPPPVLRLRARAARDMKKAPGRLEFQRGVLRQNAQGQSEVVNTGQQGSHIFSSLSQGNCFIVLERERGNVAAGEWVEVELFNHLLAP